MVLMMDNSRNLTITAPLEDRVLGPFATLERLSSTYLASNVPLGALVYYISSFDANSLDYNKSSHSCVQYQSKNRVILGVRSLIFPEEKILKAYTSVLPR